MSRNALPVDAGLARIDALLDQPADELLGPPLDLALDQRVGHVERDPRGQLPQQVVAHLALGGALGLAPADPARTRGPQRLERLELAEILGELVVERRAPRAS